MNLLKRARIKKRKIILQSPDNVKIIKEDITNIKWSQHGYTVISNKKFIWKNKIQSIIHSIEDKKEMITLHIKIK